MLHGVNRGCGRGRGRRGGPYRRGRAVQQLNADTVRREIQENSCKPCPICKTTFKRFGIVKGNGKIAPCQDTDCGACRRGLMVPTVASTPEFLLPYANKDPVDYRILSAVRVVEFEPCKREVMPQADADRVANLGPEARLRIKRQTRRYIAYYMPRDPLVRAKKCDAKLAAAGDPAAGQATALYKNLIQNSSLYQYWLDKRRLALGAETVEEPE